MPRSCSTLALLTPRPGSSGSRRAGDRRALRQRGITLLEIMIVLAIIGASLMLVRSGFRLVTKADLAENSVELTALLRRANQMAIEQGEMHRVLIDLDKHAYAIEVCQGQAAIARNEAVAVNEDEKKRALLRMEGQLRGVTTEALSSDPEETARKALALAGHHVADRTCGPAAGITGDSQGKGFIRQLRSAKGIKFREVWVQHQEKSSTDGQVAIYFFPVGSTEKAVIELTDGTDVFSILLHGLTSRVELRDGALPDVEEHMMRDVKGERIKEREGER
ncbi:MAG: type II secretion system protein [Myxococcales bacterium]|jgi:prepilin-type N-terminal cleavage/methylation domain-containing protein|nr:type II secretion system protein [Myxococcales bacterium]